VAINQVTVAPTAVAGSSEQAAAVGTGSHMVRRIALGLMVVVLLFASTYMFAWYQASRLATSFLADADASYAAGKYIEALTGYEEFDPATNKYITRGGYMKTTRIWADANAWPRPTNIDAAQVRINEILNQRLTVKDAEGFIQANTGKPNPYMGQIYLLLGELYERDGDSKGAKQIYGDIPDLFPDEPDLIAQAKERLAKLMASSTADAQPS
jgi:tetratricopeptide (TPR) repeat protein